MLDFNCGIYTITSPSGRLYVGSSVNIAKRWRVHLCLLRAGRHHCAPLQRAFDKYGEARIMFAKVAFVSRGELLAREQEQIDAHPFVRLYNVLPTAGRPLGRLISAEMRARLSAALTGREFSCAARERMRRAQTGKKQSPETIEKRRAGALGREVKGATRNKISAAQIGKPRRESPNTSGFVGVTAYAGKWRAQFGRVYLGYYSTAELAATAIARYKATGSIRTGRSNSKSGYRGVSLHKSGKWQASLRVAGARLHLGTFDSPEAANDAIIAARSAKKA